MVSVDKLILFVAITCGAGGTQTLMAIDNIGQISGDGGRTMNAAGRHCAVPCSSEEPGDGDRSEASGLIEL